VPQANHRVQGRRVYDAYTGLFRAEAAGRAAQETARRQAADSDTPSLAHAPLLEMAAALAVAVERLARSAGRDAGPSAAGDAAQQELAVCETCGLPPVLQQYWVQAVARLSAAQSQPPPASLTAADFVASVPADAVKAAAATQGSKTLSDLKKQTAKGRGF
jgi:uncharacterized ParB-like nuclease family protein